MSASSSTAAPFARVIADSSGYRDRQVALFDALVAAARSDLESAIGQIADTTLGLQVHAHLEYARAFLPEAPAEVRTADTVTAVVQRHRAAQQALDRLPDLAEPSGPAEKWHAAMPTGALDKVTTARNALRRAVTLQPMKVRAAESRMIR